MREQEGKENHLDPADDDPMVVRAMLDFLYRSPRNLPDPNSNVHVPRFLFHLFVLGDKYMIPPLAQDTQRRFTRHLLRNLDDAETWNVAASVFKYGNHAFKNEVLKTTLSRKEELFGNEGSAACRATTRSCAEFASSVALKVLPEWIEAQRLLGTHHLVDKETPDERMIFYRCSTQSCRLDGAVAGVTDPVFPDADVCCPMCGRTPNCFGGSDTRSTI